uniref:C2H2-type domain-containing protein n=1 Tax=Acrobeloides nanus TaxID=290746 RepID=A0A914EFX2_9BILA
MREKTIVDLSNMERRIYYVTYYSSSDDDSTLDSAASGSEKRKTKESTPVAKARSNGIKKEISQPPRGNSSARDDELRKGNLLDQRRKRNQQQNKRSSVLLDNLAPLPPPPNGLPACEYQNLAKGNGQAIVEKPLPKLPPDLGEDDDEEGGVVVDDEEDAVYINTRIPLIRNRTDGGTSTNDSGIGGSTADGLPQDYANARLPLKPTRVSQKIQQLLQTLQRRVVAFLIYRSIAVHIRSPSPNYLRPATPFSSSTAWSVLLLHHCSFACDQCGKVDGDHPAHRTHTK